MLTQIPDDSLLYVDFGRSRLQMRVRLRFADDTLIPPGTAIAPIANTLYSLIRRTDVYSNGRYEYIRAYFSMV